MSLNYSLYLDRSILEGEVANLLASYANSRDSDSQLVACANLVLDDYEKEHVNGSFGFSPETGVLFRLDKFNDDDSAFKKMIHICLALFKQRTNNALLVFEGEATVFLYKNPIVYLNSSRSFWEDRQRILMFENSFELKTLPDLD
jgi:hypothetical protein